jgi:hypothetical protein
MGVLDATTRELIVHTSATKRSTDFICWKRLTPASGPGRDEKRKRSCWCLTTVRSTP